MGSGGGITGNLIGGDVGNFIDRNVGGTAGDLIKNPLRGGLAYATGGLSEVGIAGFNRLVGDPRFEGNAAAQRAKDQQASVEAQMAENDRKQLLTQSRDQTRTQQKQASLQLQGRQSTILTSPLGASSGTSILGS